MRTRPEGSKDDADWGLAAADTMLETAAEFGIVQTYTMCPAEDIAPFRQRFGDRLRFNGPISKKAIDSPDDEAYRLLDRFLEQGVEIIKFWSAPRGRDRGLFVDAPWRIEAARRAVRPASASSWSTSATPTSGFATFTPTPRVRHEGRSIRRPRADAGDVPRPDLDRGHMGGDPEHADHLENLLEHYPHLYLDTSATKWQVREVSAHRDAIRALIVPHAGRVSCSAPIS